MIKKLIRKIKAWLYAVPFAMKAGDEVIAAPAMDPSEGTGLHEQKLQQHSVLQDLLEGKLTKEVEELRYTMYKAEEESNKYQHIGNGVTIKKEMDLSKIKTFTVQNIDLIYNSQECAEMVEKGEVTPPTRKLINIEYNNPCVRFKIENHCNSVKVYLGKKKTIELNFLNDNNNPYSRPLINQLRKVINDINGLTNTKSKKTYIEKSEICGSISKIEFITHNATNNVPNGITYKFVNPKFESIKIVKDNIVLKFSCETIEDGKLLSEKFYSKSQDEKYKKKEKKEDYKSTINLGDVTA